MTAVGSARVALDTSGRLLELWIVPPPTWVGLPREETDWRALFEAADLDPDAFDPVEAQWTWPVDSDLKLAWRGSYPGSHEFEVTVEAGALQGHPVLFRLRFPWTSVSRLPGPTAPAGVALRLFVNLWFLTLLGATVLIARRNLRLGRGDRRRATRLASSIALLFATAFLFGVHHVAAPDELGLLISGIGGTLFWCAVVAATYLAIEPYYRRFWPRQMISWMRLLDEQFRDPLVGRDLLIGCLGGTVLVLYEAVRRMALRAAGVLFDGPMAVQFGPTSLGVGPASGIGNLLASFANLVAFMLIQALSLLVMIVVLRMIGRSTWAAYTLVLVAYGGMFMAISRTPSVSVPSLLVLILVGVFLLWRFGVLCFLTVSVLPEVMIRYPLTLDLTSWYLSNSILVLAVIGGLASYGFYTSLGGRTVFEEQAAELVRPAR